MILFRRIRNQFNKEMREYYKMRRKHRKELIKLVKNGADFDWGYLHDLVITKIRHMYEYYTARNNVWQTDETLLPTIDELKYVLDLQKELDGLDDKYKPNIKMIIGDDNVVKITADENATNLIQEKHKREDELYKEIYAYIGEYLRGWWD